MDAILRASFGPDYLAFRSIEHFVDGKQHHINLEIKSGPFSANYPFWVESSEYESFLIALSSIYENLSGAVRLKPLWEP